MLARTALAEKYWVCGGLLLGWAREGRVLAHDRDADFGFLRSDGDVFRAAIPHLVAAGFTPFQRWTNNHGEPTEYCFVKGAAKFEFFEFRRQGETFRSFVYDGWVEIRCALPVHGLAPMAFLGRTWQKPADHDAYLTAVYGNWKVPDPHYDYRTDQKDIVERVPWRGTNAWPAGEDGKPSRGYFVRNTLNRYCPFR